MFQQKPVYVLLIVGLCALKAAGQGIVGRWQGTLTTGITERVALNITRAKNGKLGGEVLVMDHVQRYPLRDVTFVDGALTLQTRDETWSYTATISSDRNSLDGTWKFSATTKGMTLQLKRATKATAWKFDSTPHKVTMLTVAKGVKLEVLDWGGTGVPLVFLAGLGDSAHAFDGFAPKLAGKFHVYGITRRGYGESTHPAPFWQNYTANQLGDDVLSVVQQLKLDRPIVIGHSIAGEELSSIGSKHSEAVRGLVYLDAGFAYAMFHKAPGIELIEWNEFRDKVQAITDARTPQEQRQLIDQMLKENLPEYEDELKKRLDVIKEEPDAHATAVEVRRSHNEDISQAVHDGEQRFDTIKCPALLIYNKPRIDDLAPDADQKAKNKHQHQIDDAKTLDDLADRFHATGSNVTVDMIPNAQHYIYRSNEMQDLVDINKFADSLR